MAERSTTPASLLCGALLLLPALVFVPHAQHVFWVPESFAAQLFAPLAALAAWLAMPRESQEQALPKPLRLSALAFALCLLASAASAARRDLAAWQLLEWSAYPLAFAAAWRQGSQPQGRRRALFFLLAAGALNALYALVQAAGLDRFAWAANFSGRSGGFLGNPNFLGGHLALLAPLALALALDTRRKFRTLRWVLTALFLAALFISQTRGAWAGAALGLLSLAFLAHRRLPGLLSRNRSLLLSLAGLFAVVSLTYLSTKPHLIQRLGETLRGEDQQLSHRLFLMRKAAQLAGRHPFLGVGPGNFRLAYPEVQVQGIPNDALAGQVYVQSEHAHNDFLQMAADAGWPAALLWLTLLAQLAFLLIRGLGPPSPDAERQGDGREPLALLGLACGLLALHIHGLANFPFLLVPTQLSAWAMAALALRLALPRPSLPQAPQEASPSPEGGGGTKARIFARFGGWGGGWGRKMRLITTLVLLAAALNTWRLGRGLATDMLWWIGQGELGLGHADKASPLLFRALDWGRIPWLGIERQEERLWLLHGRAEAERGYVWNAVGSLKECLRLDLLNPEAGVRLGRAYLELKLPKDAEPVLLAVAKRAPNFVDLWEPLAASYFLQEKWADAVAAYDWQIFFNVSPESAYANKAAAQGNLGQLPQALLTLKAAQQRFPMNGKIQLNLAITYLKLGMKKESRAAFAEASRLSPNDPQIDQLKGALR